MCKEEILTIPHTRVRKQRKNITHWAAIFPDDIPSGLPRVKVFSYTVRGVIYLHFVDALLSVYDFDVNAEDLGLRSTF